MASLSLVCVCICKTWDGTVELCSSSCLLLVEFFVYIILCVDWLASKQSQITPGVTFILEP